MLDNAHKITSGLLVVSAWLFSATTVAQKLKK